MKVFLCVLLFAVAGRAQNSDLIESEISLMDALSSTLRNHPLLRIQEQQVQFTRAALLRAESQFDRVLQGDLGQSHVYLPFNGLQHSVYDAFSSTQNLTALNATATQQFRNGITAGPTFDVGRVTDSIITPYGLSQSHVGFQVNVPLLRGRGRGVVLAQETAAEIEVDASVLDLNQSISDLLAGTVSAYWNAVAAKRLAGVYEDAESRGQIYVQTVRSLIDADKLPRAEISQVLANLASKAAQRISAQQQFLQARQALALAMGLPADQMDASPGPRDALPRTTDHPIALEARAQSKLIEQALRRRADLLAARRRSDEAGVLSNASINQLKPQLDIRFGTGYSGLREGTRIDQYLVSPFTGVRGVDITGGIHYQLPLGNRAAQAVVMQTSAVARQAYYKVQETSRNIVSGVITALDALRKSLDQLEKSQESVTYARITLESERTKLRMGVGSLVDVLTVEERLNAVQVSEVQADLNVALSLTRLRQATGTIVEPRATVQSIDKDVFLTTPEVNLEVRTMPR
jgi:outer membrane protein TolC